MRTRRALASVVAALSGPSRKVFKEVQGFRRWALGIWNFGPRREPRAEGREPLFKAGHYRFAAAAAAVLLGAALDTSAQIATATVLGLVRDQTGASLPGATVTVRSLATGAAR